MVRLLLDLLFPPVSLGRSDGAWLTPAELAGLRETPVIRVRAELRERGIEGVDRMVVAAHYASPMLRAALHRFKYRRIRAYDAMLGTMLADASKLLIHEPAPVLCPVPLHWLRRFHRGFNQADILSQCVARERAWDVQSLLVRTRWTGTQVRRSTDERRRAVHNAFSFIGRDVPRAVVLVDDVCTSGATLTNCAAALRQSGVVSVQALVLATG